MNASTIEEQFNLLKHYGILPENASLPYKGPYKFSLIFLGLAFPPIPLALAMTVYGHVFHLMPLAIIFLNFLFKIVNILTPPPLPEISVGYLFGGVGSYRFMVKTPTHNYTYNAGSIISEILLISYGFVGWKIYIPVKIFTGFGIAIFGIPVPIPLSITIFIGASLYLRYWIY